MKLSTKLPVKGFPAVLLLTLFTMTGCSSLNGGCFKSCKKLPSHSAYHVEGMAGGYDGYNYIPNVVKP